jgi:hypothetical protein
MLETGEETVTRIRIRKERYLIRLETGTEIRIETGNQARDRNIDKDRDR